MVVKRKTIVTSHMKCQTMTTGIAKFQNIAGMDQCAGGNQGAGMCTLKMVRLSPRERRGWGFSVDLHHATQWAQGARGFQTSGTWGSSQEWGNPNT